MDDIEEVNIDVIDRDFSVPNLKAYYHRALDCYYFPRDSMELLGDIDPETGDALLSDEVVAKAVEIVFNGRKIACWSVRWSHFITQPAREPD